MFVMVDEGPAYHSGEKQPAVAGLSDNARLELLSRLARENSDKKSINGARIYLAEASEFARQKKLPLPYNYFWARAQLYALQKDYCGAMGDMANACSLLSKTHRYQDLAVALSFHARMMHYCGKFKESVALYNQAIRLAEERKLKNVIPECYRGLADVYVTAGKEKEQRDAVLKMIDWAKKENNRDYLSRGYFRLGQFSNEVDSNFEKSNEFYKQALQIRVERGDTVLFPSILNRISWNYYLLKQYDTALQYYKKTLDISLKLRNYPTVANAYGNMGTIYRDKKMYEKAMYFYGQSNAYSMITRDYETLAWTNKDMSDMFREMGDYKKAYSCYVLYKNYDDSVNTMKYSVGLADARTRYETDSKARELEVMNLKVNQQKYFIAALSGFIFLSLVIGLLLFRQSRLNSKRQISEMNRRISEITQANLRQQMNPHFIFNTLNSIQYYMYQHDKLAVNNYLTKFSSLMRKTLENSQHTAIPLSDELDALELYLELESLRFKEKFDYSIEVDEDIDRLLYKIPTMLLQPYVENAIGHGLINKEGRGKLAIHIALKQDYLCFTIEDNGVGRKEAMRIKQSKEKNYPPLGTKITESRMELANAFYGTRMTVNYTDLTDHSGNPAGTRVVIQIPIIT